MTKRGPQVYNALTAINS